MTWKPGGGRPKPGSGYFGGSREDQNRRSLDMLSLRNYFGEVVALESSCEERLKKCG